MGGSRGTRGRSGTRIFVLATIVATAVCIVVFLGPARPSPAAAASWVHAAVTGGDRNYLGPQVYGDWVTWYAWDGSHYRVYLRNVRFEHIGIITDAAVSALRPDIGRNWVVYEQIAGGEHDVVALNLLTGTRGPVSTTTQDQLYPSTDGRAVAWQQDDGHDYEIWTARVGAGGVTQVSNDGADDQYPVVAGDLLTWVTAPYNVMLYSNLSHSKSTVAGTAAQEWEADTDGRYVVYAAHDGHDFEIYRFDTADHSVLQVTNNGVNDGSPTVSGRRVAWSSYEGGDWDLYVRDMEAGITTHLTNDGLDDTGARLHGPRLVFENYEGSSSGGPLRSIQRFDFQQFTDVPPSHPNYFAVQSLADEGTVGGYGTGLYGPADSLLRAQFAKIIVEALGLAVDESSWNPAAPPFLDLDADDPATLYPHDHIAVAKAQGIVQGTSATTFAPWTALSRAQMVTMTMRAVAHAYGVMLAIPIGYTGTFGDFSPDHAKAMKAAEHEHLLDGIAGFGPGWDPWAPATRAEMAQLVWVARELFGR